MKDVTKVIVAVAMLLSAQNLFAQRIKDFVEVEGARPNFISADGLVVGLNGNGDSSKGATIQRFRAYLVNQDSWKLTEADIVSKNVALVHVEAELPPFQAEGTKIDIRVSALGDAKSLTGGTLLITPLRSPRAREEDKIVYALAQGAIVIEGGAAGNPTSGYIPNGAIIEKAVRTDFVRKIGSNYFYITLHLNKTDFSLANTIANKINSSNLLGDLTSDEVNKLSIAKAIDGGRIEVRMPTAQDFQRFNYDKYPDFISEPVKFVSAIIELPIQLVQEDSAIVIINDKTKVISVTGEVWVRKGRAQKGTVVLNVLQDSLLVDLLASDVKDTMSAQDVIDLLKSFNQMGLIKGKVISQ